MNMKSLILVLLLFIEGCLGYRVVCVYTNWSQYRPEGGKFLPEDVDATLCTHLIYVYAKLKVNKLEPTEWNDEGSAWSEGMYGRVNNLKQLNPELKTLLGVGGWMMGSKGFSKLAASRTSRRIFARTSVKFLRDRNFDGLTIDWQHPTKRGGKPRDKINFSLLLKEIREAFEADSKKTGLPPLLLTAGVSASREIIGSAYEIENITKYTDFINVMAYDLHGAWDNYTGHPSQLYAREEEFGPSTEINVDASMRYWMSHVADRSKLVLGISTYGRTFTLRKARHNEYNVPTTGPGIAGEFTRQPGMLAYYERCAQYADAPRVWDVASQVAYWHSGDQWIAGEDVESVKAKVNWTRTYDIGGLMIWSMDTDDFADVCQSIGYPLLNTVVLELNDPSFVRPNISIERRMTETEVHQIPTTTEAYYSDTMTTKRTTVQMTTASSTTTSPKPRPTTSKISSIKDGIKSRSLKLKQSSDVAKTSSRDQTQTQVRKIRKIVKNRQLNSRQSIKIKARKMRMKQINRIQPVRKMKMKRRNRVNPNLQGKVLKLKSKHQKKIRTNKNRHRKIIRGKMKSTKVKNANTGQGNVVKPIEQIGEAQKFTMKAPREKSVQREKQIKVKALHASNDSNKRLKPNDHTTASLGKSKDTKLAMVSKRKQSAIHILPNKNSQQNNLKISEMSKSNILADKGSTDSIVPSNIEIMQEVTSITAKTFKKSDNIRQTNVEKQSQSLEGVKKSNKITSKEIQKRKRQRKHKMIKRRTKPLKNGKRLKRRRQKAAKKESARV